MIKVILVALTPFLLVFLNNYFKNKALQDDRKFEDRSRKKRRTSEVTYNHEWDDDDRDSSS